MIINSVQDLLSQLSQQDSVIITPNQRLALYWQKQYAQQQKDLGKLTWSTPAIYSLKTWLSKCWQDCPSNQALLSDFQESMLWEKIIAETKTSGDFANYGPDKITGLVKEAWALKQQWQIQLDDLLGLTEETAKFKIWALQFANYCKKNHWIDKNSLLDTLPTYFRGARKIASPCRIILTDFLEIPPQLSSFLTSLEKTAQIVIKLCDTNTLSGNQFCIEFEKQKQEILCMARWAKKQIEKNPDANIGCIVPNLQNVRRPILDIFSKVFAPEMYAAAQAQNASSIIPNVNISLGNKLGDFTLINHAFQILELGKKNIELTVLRTLLLSPFIANYQEEMSARATFEVELSTLPYDKIALAKIIAQEKYLEKCQAFKTCLTEHLRLLPQFSHKKTTTQWASIFVKQLQAFSWPGNANLSDTEQPIVVHRFHELLHEFSNLTSILPEISHDTALNYLKEMAAETVMQTKTSGEAKIHILGTLEATGINFAAIWFMGLDHETWPSAPSPNPFIAINLQKKLHMAHACADRELEFCQSVTKKIASSAQTVIYSFAKCRDDYALKLSPLIVGRDCILNENKISGLAQIYPSSLGIPRGAAEQASGRDVPPGRLYLDVHEGEAGEEKAQLFPAERLLQGCKRLAVCAKQDAARKAERRPQQSGKPKCEGYTQITDQDLDLADYSDMEKELYTARELEEAEDCFVPIHEEIKIRGGSEILQHQALCPFQAFARHRLKIKSATPKIFALRGTVVHAVLEKFWQNIKTHECLCATANAALNDLLVCCIDYALNKHANNHFPTDFLRIEKQCLAKLLQQWINIEKNRYPFMVVALEKSIDARLGNLNINLRVDRIDALADGKVIILDYKTGKKLPSINEWLSEQLTNPQLPLYCIMNGDENINGTIFAHVNITSKTPKQSLHGISQTKIAEESSIKIREDWEQLKTTWRDALEKLAHDFACGKADVTPLNEGTCKNCGFEILCRIKELQVFCHRPETAT